MFPHFLAGGDLVADNRLLFATLLLRIQIIPDDGERGPTGTDVVAPEFPGRVALPVGGEPNAGQTAVAVWSAETGPVAGLKVQGPELMCGGRQGRQGFASAQFCQKSLLGRGTEAPAHRWFEAAVDAVDAKKPAVAPGQHDGGKDSQSAGSPAKFRGNE